MPSGVYIRTEEYKRKLSEAKKGKKLSEETRRRMSKAKKGKHYPKVSEARRGKQSTLGKHWKLSERTKERMKGNKNAGGSKHKPKFHTEETKQKIRDARLKQKLPTIDTSIERKTKEWFDRKGINYIHPFNLGDKFQCDFYLPFLNLIVECDGTYWHSREDMKKRDKAKDAYAKKCGFNILRLSEEQINQGRFF